VLVAFCSFANLSFKLTQPGLRALRPLFSVVHRSVCAITVAFRSASEIVHRLFKVGQTPTLRRYKLPPITAGARCGRTPCKEETLVGACLPHCGYGLAVL